MDVWITEALGAVWIKVARFAPRIGGQAVLSACRSWCEATIALMRTSLYRVRPVVKACREWLSTLSMNTSSRPNGDIIFEGLFENALRISDLPDNFFGRVSTDEMNFDLSRSYDNRGRQ